MIKKSVIAILTLLSVIIHIVPVNAAKTSETLDKNIKLAICAYGKVGSFNGSAEVFQTPPYKKDDSSSGYSIKHFSDLYA